LGSSSPVKNELAVDFPTAQEDMSCKELEDHVEALYGYNSFCHVKSVEGRRIRKRELTEIEPWLSGVTENEHMNACRLKAKEALRTSTVNRRE
jgi:hypothetical protein